MTAQVVEEAKDLDSVDVAAARKRGRAQKVIMIVSATWLVVMIALALTADLLPLRDPSALGLEPKQRPGSSLSEPLGTDYLGRSMTSRVIYGARVSLGVGVGATVLGLVVGLTLGLAAGYFGGKLDAFLMVVLDSMLALPPLVLLLALVAVLTPSTTSLIGSLAFLVVPTFARLARANTMTISRREFVLAARVAGATHFRMIFREILPNVMLPVMSFAFVVVAWMIVAEGSASFLGLGIPPPTPSWGSMIASSQNLLRTDPYLVFVPAGVMFVTIFAANALGDQLRVILDPHDSSR